MPVHKRGRALRPGDVVEVRPAPEILATLGDGDALAGVPFMPEMLRYVGKRFTVSRRVEKICDTAGGSYWSRRVRDTVFLEDLRCDGSAHGGCQAGCRLYWREEWLRRVGSRDEPPEASDPSAQELLESRAVAGTRTTRQLEGAVEDVYRCQATEALRYSEPLNRYDPRQYIRELLAGNVGLLHLLRVGVRSFTVSLQRRLGRMTYIPFETAKWSSERNASPTAPRALDLRPGELVRVRPKEEIAGSLDEKGTNRGLWFDWEMIPYCGGTYRVQDRVERFIDDTTGRLVELSSDCVILEGVVCTGDHSVNRWLCPRAIYPFWREGWLQRPDGESRSEAEAEH